MATVVASLVATLGLAPKKGEWSAGTALINGVKKAVAGLTAGVGLNAIKGLVESTLDLGGHLSDTSQKLGVSAEALQELGFAAQLCGADMETLETGFVSLARVVDAARGGSKEARKAFSDLGLNWKEIAKLKPEDQFLKIADAIAKMPDGGRKTALTMAVLGKAGANLIPTLNNGADGLARMREEAKATGDWLSNETVAQLDDAGDQIDILKKVIAGVGTSLVVSLLPAIQSAVAAVQEFVTANYDLISTAVGGFIEGVVGAFQVLGKVISFVGDLFGGITDKSEILGAAAAGLGAAMVAAAVASAAAWLAALAPFLAIGAAIAAIILVVRAVRRHWDDLKNGIASALRSIKSAINSFGDSINSIFVGVAEAVAAPFIAAFGFISGVIEGVIDSIKDAIQWAKDAANAVKDFFADTIFGDSRGAFARAKAIAETGVDPGPGGGGPNALDGTFSAPVRATTPAGSSSVISVAAPTTIQVTTQPGQDNQAIADMVTTHIDTRFEKILRQAAAGVGNK